MSQNDADDVLVETIRELNISKLVPQVYEDLLQPAAREVGRSLVTVARTVNVALSPVEGLIWGYDQIRDWLAVALTRRLASPGQRICSPSETIAGPAFLNLRFCANEAQLRDLYANLIASAMKEESKDSVHPAFVHLIQQLCADEALLLRSIEMRLKGETAILKAKYGDDTPIQKRPQELDWQFYKLCQEAGLRSPWLAEAYLDNLLRLRLLARESERSARFVPEHGDRYGTYDAEVVHDYSDTIRITDLGMVFIETCVAEPSIESN